MLRFLENKTKHKDIMEVVDLIEAGKADRLEKEAFQKDLSLKNTKGSKSV